MQLELRHQFGKEGYKLCLRTNLEVIQDGLVSLGSPVSVTVVLIVLLINVQ